jgi:hypothetical protein
MARQPFSNGLMGTTSPPLLLVFGKLFPALLAAFPSGDPPHSFGRDVCLRPQRCLVVQDLVHHPPPSKVLVLSARSQKSVGDLTAPPRSLMVSPRQKVRGCRPNRLIVPQRHHPLRILLNQSQGSRFDLDQSRSLTLCGLPISMVASHRGRCPGGGSFHPPPRWLSSRAAGWTFCPDERLRGAGAARQKVSLTQVNAGRD